VGTWDGSVEERLYRLVRRHMGRFKPVPLDERYVTADCTALAWQGPPHAAGMGRALIANLNVQPQTFTSTTALKLPLAPTLLSPACATALTTTAPLHPGFNLASRPNMQRYAVLLPLRSSRSATARRPAIQRPHRVEPAPRSSTHGGPK
jgi:hypothetical protein